MSNMENLNAQLSEKERQRAVYERAMASISLQRKYREGEGEALMFAWDAFGEQTREKGMFRMASQFAMMFCIAFAFLLPSLLFIRFVM